MIILPFDPFLRAHSDRVDYDWPALDCCPLLRLPVLREVIVPISVLVFDQEIAVLRK